VIKFSVVQEVILMHNQGATQIVNRRKLGIILPRWQGVVEMKVWVLEAVT
jgi:hypothetical protein